MTPPAVTPPRQEPPGRRDPGRPPRVPARLTPPAGPGHGVDAASRTSPLLTAAAVTDVHTAHPGSPPFHGNATPTARQLDGDHSVTRARTRRARPTTAASPAGGCWASTRATAGSPTRSTSPPATPVLAARRGARPHRRGGHRRPGHAHRRRRGPRLGHDQPGRHPYRPGGPAPVVAYDSATGALKALRTGTAVLRVTVNGMTAERTIAVHRGRARAAGPSGCSRVRGAPGRAAPIGGAGTRAGLPRAPRGQAWSRRCVVHAQR